MMLKNSELDRELFARSVRKVISAVTGMPGSDCVLYAAVGAIVLSKMGYEATPSAGSAAWRVGPGDSDVVSHASEIPGAIHAPSSSEGSMSGLIHAWITVESEGGIEIVDLTTWQLRKKARELDLADGGRTEVQFCPDYLWENVKSKRLMSPYDVLQSFDHGVYAYIRKSNVERMVFSESLMGEASRLGSAALMCYQMESEGGLVQVVGLGEGGSVHEDAPMNLKQVPRGTL